ncbi:MAG: hypothetical protein R2730_03445 [Chitinophagales bacterium]
MVWLLAKVGWDVSLQQAPLAVILVFPLSIMVSPTYGIVDIDGCQPVVEGTLGKLARSFTTTDQYHY